MALPDARQIIWTTAELTRIHHNPEFACCEHTCRARILAFCKRLYG